MVFLRYGADHHTIALGLRPGGVQPPSEYLRISHFAMEVESIETCSRSATGCARTTSRSPSRAARGRREPRRRVPRSRRLHHRAIRRHGAGRLGRQSRPSEVLAAREVARRGLWRIPRRRSSARASAGAPPMPVRAREPARADSSPGGIRVHRACRAPGHYPAPDARLWGAAARRRPGWLRRAPPRSAAPSAVPVGPRRGAGRAAAPAREPTTVRVGVISVTLPYWVVWAGDAKGYFADEGIDNEVTATRAMTNGLPRSLVAR